MTKIVAKTALAGLAALALTAGTAFALDSSHEAHKQAGNHQFYVWCTGAEDYTLTKQGANAEAAQAAAWDQLKAEGKSTCWPIWQGLAG